MLSVFGKSISASKGRQPRNPQENKRSGRVPNSILVRPGTAPRRAQDARGRAGQISGDDYGGQRFGRATGPTATPPTAEYQKGEENQSEGGGGTLSL